MKRLLCYIVLLVCCLSAHAQTNTDDLLQKINSDSIRNNVEALEAFPTRFAFSPFSKDVAFYLKDRMEYYGFETVIDSFYMEDYIWGDMERSENMFLYNVLALKRAYNQNTDTSIFLGAHYDNRSTSFSFNDSYILAPGADDNASGVACLLEIARVLSESTIENKYNIRIEFYAGEEVNLLGSSHRLQSISYDWTPYPIAMINLDMVGNNLSDSIQINYYDNCDWLTNIVYNNTVTHTNLIPKFTQEFIERSDSWMFFAWGFDAVFLSENDFSPFYHTPQDSSVFLDYDYMSKITNITLAITFDIMNKGREDVFIENEATDNEDIICYFDNATIYLPKLPNNLRNIVLVNQLGEIVFETNKAEQKINISTLPKGCYILLLETTTTTKIVKKIIKF